MVKGAYVQSRIVTGCIGYRAGRRRLSGRGRYRVCSIFRRPGIVAADAVSYADVRRLIDDTVAATAASTYSLQCGIGRPDLDLRKTAETGRYGVDLIGPLSPSSTRAAPQGARRRLYHAPPALRCCAREPRCCLFRCQARLHLPRPTAANQLAVTNIASMRSAPA